MIFLNIKEDPVVLIDRDLVMNYKHEGDLYLVSIKHNLTKQLVAYMVYWYLQQVNNAFYKIIKGLVKQEYTDLNTLRNDYSEFIKSCNTFIKNCEGMVSDNVFDSVSKSLDKLQLSMQKLLYIAENICSTEEE